MSSSIRAVSKHSRALSRALAAPRQTRAFHTPFAVLYAAQPLAHSTPQPPPHEYSPLYEKQVENTAAPTLSHTGQRVYVVSEPDPRASKYEVPYGAYPTSAPYINYAPTDAPVASPHSSTSTDPAHPVTTRAAPQGPTGSIEGASRNPQPDAPEVAEKNSALGVDNAWKERK